MRRLRYNPIIRSAYNVWLRLLTCGVKSYVFCATTGRSGTETLARLIDCAPNVAAFHEPYPKMKNDTPDRYNLTLRDVFLLIKRNTIRKSSIGYKHYFESNHLFILNYADLAVSEFGKKVKIIHLRRDVVDVARSFFAIESIPGRTESGIKWMPHPFKKTNIIQLSEELQRLDHPFYSCLWYWYEVEARIQRFKQMYPWVPVYFIRTQDLNCRDKLKNMFEFFGFAWDEDAINNVIGKSHNVKPKRKKNVLGVSEAVEMNRILLNILKDRYSCVVEKIDRWQ